MKFTEGLWRLKEGIHIDWAENVAQSSEHGRRLQLLLTKRLEHRGDTLNSATITTTVTSPMEDVIGVKYVHWAGEVDKGPHFTIHHHDTHVELTRKENELQYDSGNLQLRINTGQNAFSTEFRSNDMAAASNLTSHSDRSVGYVSDEKPYPYEDGLFRDRKGYMLAGLDLSYDEKIYGLGERFGPLILNGQSVTMSNEDGGSSSEMAYKNIPFYLSSKGYGVFVNHPGHVSFEVGTERTTRVNISVAGQELEYFVIYGPSPAEVLRKYSALVGRPAVPPVWSYQLWLSTSFTTEYDEGTITSFLDGFKDKGIPLGAMHLDCFWMKAFQWCDFEFDKDIYPDYNGLLRRLKDRGLKVCVWINPYIAQASPLFEEGRKSGYFIKRTNGDIFQWDAWQAGMALVDFTNPDARTWYQSKLFRLVTMGVDSFKTDFGERIPRHGIVYHNHADPERMHNYYSYLYNKTVHEVLYASPGPMQGCLFARSATAGGQQFPVHWGGDNFSTFESMAETLRGGLSAAVSGIAFWAHDIGGFDGDPTPALYKRWCQFGLLSSHSRLHGLNSYRIPWNFGDEACDVLRDSVKRKLSLMPYILKEALNSHTTGVPVMRPLFFEYPRDPTAQTVQTQYFFGSNLLVAPVFSESNRVRFYVPGGKGEGEGEGSWVSWFDMSKRYEGGKWYEEEHSFFSLPLLIRPSSVTAINPTATEAIEEMNKNMELFVNGPITEKVVVDIVDAVEPNRVKRKVTVTPEREGKCILINVGENEGMQWSVLYFGNAVGGEENKGFKKFITSESRMCIELE